MSPLALLLTNESVIGDLCSLSQAVKTFAEMPGCLGIAKQLKQEMLAFQVNVPVVQARDRREMRSPGKISRYDCT